MRKRFNTTGICYPDEHYMVDIRERLKKIRGMVERGEYFCINRARQYGKTTTLSLLKKELEDEYVVFSISFEGIGTAAYESDTALARAFLQLINDCLIYGEAEGVSEELREMIAIGDEDNGAADISLLELSRLISRSCAVSDKPVVLIIDEADQAGNYSAFLEFLGMLRDKYLRRRERPTFRSVILASVYDIKNLKLRLGSNEEHRYNSPWNIAADFEVDMNFTKADIEGMLVSYENDRQTGMDISGMASLLYEYTSGYPFLVSRLCKLMDEKIAGTEEYPDEKTAWSRCGFQAALGLLMSESNTLFDDMRKKLSDNPNLKKMLYELLYEGQAFPYNSDDELSDIGYMFGYIKNTDGKITVANRIFETRLYNLFISEERMQILIYTEGSKDRSLFVKDGELDMRRVLERFVVHFTDLYGQCEEAFIEKAGRKFFLFFLKPIINGTGNYYVEAETRDERRTDVVVDYLGKQYIVELKIYHGNAYNERGEQQLSDYLDEYHLKKGYMLSFNFNKNKKTGMKEIKLGDKTIVEAVV